MSRGCQSAISYKMCSIDFDLISLTQDIWQPSSIFILSLLPCQNIHLRSEYVTYNVGKRS